jgi:hypothetical protein
MNENIGELGRAFIAQRTDIGIDFDEAWAEWKRLSSLLLFVLTECPEVRHYDDRTLTDRDERLRIRELAQVRIGQHIRSSDVSLLAKAAEGLNVVKPVRPYYMDRETVRALLTSIADEVETKKGYTENVAALRHAADDEDEIESMAKNVERFVGKHGLWHVPSKWILYLYMEHQQREGASKEPSENI